MKKLLATMMTLAAAMTLFSATASAQSFDMRHSKAHFDYDTTLQMVGATAGAGIGIVGGGAAGVALGDAMCTSHGAFLGCLGEVVIGGGVGMLVGGVSGAVIGTSLTGGDYADPDDYVGAAGGALVGGLVAIPVTFGVSLFSTAFMLDSGVATGIGLAAAATSVGVGAALGYQSNYRAPRGASFSVAPLLGEHNGLVLSGRF